MDPLTLETPGKINLYLKVEGRRADGWHDLLTLFYPIPGLSDRITLRFGGEGVRIVCDVPGVPLDRGNLAVKAAEAYYAAAGAEVPGMEIRIEKHLPVAGGMGGGSSDAGAVLRLLQSAEGKLTPARLARTALEIGSDVPFFLHPVPSIGRGRGEILTPVDLSADLPLLLVPGSFPVSAGWAFRHWRPDGNDTGPEYLIASLRAHDLAAAGALLRNDLEPAALQKFPMLSMIADHLRRTGGAPLMSGSGPTMFALYPDPASHGRACRELADLFAEYDIPLLPV
ncbi:MAG: 4-(cytidine 5'-diphospho)-2-C-methyl-D-erythritol kinase [Lentisphaeria bacterium]|nr:4-(cytidine 5'-diphospho)-2-C-methyl-D-erythritol kinase [Lentisphaeria bacterium]